MMLKNTIKTVFSNRAFSQQLDKLHSRLITHKRLYKASVNGLSFTALSLHRNSLFKQLRHDLCKHTYKPEHSQLNTLTQDNKQRSILAMNPIDQLVQSTLLDYLQQCYVAQAPANCHAYTRGRGIGTAISAISQYINQQKQLASSTDHRDIYLLKTDIASYADSIPIHNTSPLWKKLQTLLNWHQPLTDDQEYLWFLIQQSFRPIITGDEQAPFQYHIGVPLGTYVFPLAANLYCQTIDQQFENFSGFYSRYSDDIVIAHTDPHILLAASEQLDQELTKLQLQRQAEKDEYFYLNPAAKPSTTIAGFTPAAAFEHLGHRIDSCGRITLSQRRLGQFIKPILRRISKTAKLLEKNTNLPLALCQATNSMISPMQNPHSTSLNMILNHMTDPGQLKHFDYLIALRIAECALNKKAYVHFVTFPIANYAKTTACYHSSICATVIDYETNIATIYASLKS